ncbi:MAG: hypothetical protein LC795_15505 [Acidobacteria bacterium]|nr:hypothetical protein [Acidobacteriota bacterium]MCA1620682.1 hypothetical protein [Acidobacteriota bacterium]
MAKYTTKFDIGDLVSTAPSLSPSIRTKQPRAGFKGRKVTEITVEADDAGESVYYVVAGAPHEDFLPGWPEYELREAFFCPCGMELCDENVQRDARDFNGDLLCGDCADEMAEVVRDNAQAEEAASAFDDRDDGDAMEANW